LKEKISETSGRKNVYKATNKKNLLSGRNPRINGSQSKFSRKNYSGGVKIKLKNTGSIALLVIVILITLACSVFADRNIPATPEIQGLSTSTGMNVQGTITETDSAAWSANANGIPLRGDDPVVAQWPGWAASYWGSYANYLATEWQPDITNYPDAHLQDELEYNINHPTSYPPDLVASSQALLTWLQNQGSSLNPPLNDQEVQVTTGYNDQLMAVSGQSVLAKSMSVSTANKIADQSNIKADTSLQYIAIDTGRATRTEELLLDGVSQASSTANAILCPFANATSPVIPAYCNIEQAGSSIDTTLTSVVPHADNRFVGTDSTFPVVLNYQVNAQGITLSDGTSSPMI
jgi:hypothetical protein